MDYQTLESLFISDPSKAVDESKKIICSITKFDSYQDFITYHKKNAVFSICPKIYTKNEEISVFCLDCSLKEDNPTTMCLSCFLNGNHIGHNYFIFPKSFGICNCGDKDLMKKSSFCAKHQGVEEETNHPEDQLDEELKNILTDLIFKAAFSSLNTFSKTFNKNISIILDFILSFTQHGDGFRRLIAITLIEKNDFDNFIFKIPENTYQFNNSLSTLFYSLLTDQLFRKSFSKSFYHVIFERILKDSPIYMSNYQYETPHVMLSNFIDFCFSEPFCRYNIEHNQWDWVSNFIELLINYKQLFQFNLDQSFKFCPYVFNIIKIFPILTQIQSNEKTQEFFDRMFTEVFNCGTINGISKDINDTIIVTSFRDFIHSKYYSAFNSFIERFSFLFNCFKSKPELKLDKLIEQLNNIDISPIFLIKKNSFANENDILISKYLIDKNNSQVSFLDKFKSAFKKIFHSYPSKYYKSFYNGASFFLSHPLFDSFGFLFKLDNICQIKLAKFISMEKYQPLRIKLGIVALKRLLSIYCFELNLTDNKNFALNNFYDNIIEMNKEIRFNFVPISLLQLLIGLQTSHNLENDEFIIKEFYAYEIAREVGLFDKNFLAEIEDKMFIFLYVSLLLVIDRTVFNFDHEKVIEERIIFALMNGINSIDDLNDVVDIIPNKPHLFYKYFNDILMKVATTNKKENLDENIKLDDIDNHSSNKIHNHDDDSSENDDNDNDNDNDNNNNNNSNENENMQENENSHASKNIMKGDIKFYLKEGINCKLISAVNSIDAQRRLINLEISKNSDKLLSMQNFEAEETYFFNSDENNSDLSIHLKHFLLTPTVFAIIYTSLLDNNYNKTQNLVNEHLAMNILILISKIIKEKESKIAAKSLNETTKINCVSIIDLVSQLKRIVYNFRIEGKDDETKGFIENTMNSATFILLMKMKISFNKLPEKSFIDLLLEKGSIGQETLQRISAFIPLQDGLNTEEENEEQKNKKLKKEKANKLKSEIMNQFQNKMKQYNFKDSISDSLSPNNSSEFQLNKEVCCLCSESSSKEILSYPLYLYRTKFPFIIDKPPLFDDDIDGISVDDLNYDFVHQIELKDILQNFNSMNSEDVMTNNILFSVVLNKLKDISLDTTKRLTAGANFVLQMGICPHPIHQSCIKNENKDIYRCSIDRSIRNCFLPFLDEIPIHSIFSNTTTFELNEDNSKIFDSISSFIEKYTSYFNYVDKDSFNVFVELIKSISGLIETYEIRFRNRPDALDPPKFKILARNLFLLVWYEYRIQKKPKLDFLINKDGEKIDIESRLTDFQILIKRLIECDEIINDIDQVRKIASSIIDSISSSGNESNLKLKEKKICLFLRRFCLAEYFLLNEKVCLNDNDSIDWDEVLNTNNLSKRYQIKFNSIKIENNEDFKFKPFLFINLPKDYIELSQSPFNFPIQFRKDYSFINFLDYNYSIKHYDDFDDTYEIQNNKENTNNENENDENSNNGNENKNKENTNNEKENENNCNEIKNDNENENHGNESKNDENKNVNNDDDEKYRRLFIDANDVMFGMYLLVFGKRVYPSMLMLINDQSPLVLISDQSFLGYITPFYVDKFGCPEINFSRRLPLFLNENYYEIFIDKILSGDFSYDLMTLDDINQEIL